MGEEDRLGAPGQKEVKRSSDAEEFTLCYFLGIVLQ
jgi:hypothetical protein